MDGAGLTYVSVFVLSVVVLTILSASVKTTSRTPPWTPVTSPCLSNTTSRTSSSHVCAVKSSVSTPYTGSEAQESISQKRAVPLENFGAPPTDCDGHQVPLDESRMTALMCHERCRNHGCITKTIRYSSPGFEGYISLA